MLESRFYLDTKSSDATPHVKRSRLIPLNSFREFFVHSDYLSIMEPTPRRPAKVVSHTIRTTSRTNFTQGVSYAPARRVCSLIVCHYHRRGMQSPRMFMHSPKFFSFASLAPMYLYCRSFTDGVWGPTGFYRMREPPPGGCCNIHPPVPYCRSRRPGVCRGYPPLISLLSVWEMCGFLGIAGGDGCGQGGLCPPSGCRFS